MNRGAIDNVKRRVRKLKQLEKIIRVQNGMGNDNPLVWDKFFDLRNDTAGTALYTLPKLAGMSREEYKNVVDEFFARVYYEVYVLRGIINATVYDPALLALLGLPPVADEVAVKKRFRELAKEYHPDAGGEHGKFVELMRVYRDLNRKG